METIKSYTDLSQSKKLVEIVPLESADMSWVSNGLGKPFARTIPVKGDPEELCGCWSLTALLNVLPLPDLIQDKADNELFWQCSVYNEDNTLLCETYDNNPVDACYEMIIKLNELNLL